MAAANIQHIPSNLGDYETKVILYLFKNPKAARVIVALCDKRSSYLNEIQKVVEGSKTRTMEVVRALEGLKIIKGEWQISEISGKGGPKTRAVRTYKLNESKEKLIEFYEPLFRKLE